MTFNKEPWLRILHSEKQHGRRRKEGLDKLFMKANRLHKQYVRHIANTKTPLKPNCEICNSTKRLGRHHFNYYRPLHVITTCPKCHGKITRLQHQGYTEQEINTILTDMVFTRQNSNLEQPIVCAQGNTCLCVPVES